MRKNKNTTILTDFDKANNQSFPGLLKFYFIQNGFIGFDFFLYSNSYQEKLPIIYANIRV